MNFIDELYLNTVFKVRSLVSNLKDEEDGVSNIVATVILILIVVVLAAALWGFLSGFFSDIFGDIFTKKDDILDGEISNPYDNLISFILK